MAIPQSVAANRPTAPFPRPAIEGPPPEPGEYHQAVRPGLDLKVAEGPLRCPSTSVRSASQSDASAAKYRSASGERQRASKASRSRRAHGSSESPGTRRERTRRPIARCPTAICSECSRVGIGRGDERHEMQPHRKAIRRRDIEQPIQAANWEGKTRRHGSRRRAERRARIAHSRTGACPRPGCARARS